MTYDKRGFTKEQKLDSSTCAAGKNNLNKQIDDKDNALHKRAELLLRATAFKLTGDYQNSFTISAEENKTHPGHRQLLTAASGKGLEAANQQPKTEAKGDAEGNAEGQAHEQAKDFHDHLVQAREQLLSVAKPHGEDITEFKRRMDQLEGRVPNEISIDEVTKTYEQIGRLLAPPEKFAPATSSKERATLARQILMQAAQPNTIRQGGHNTCNVATVESLVYTKYPSKAAAMIADLALTGQFTARDRASIPTTIKLDPHPKDYDAKRLLTFDNERTYASELFQVAAVNLFYQRQNSADHTNIRYEQREVPEDTMRGEENTGEALIDYSKHAPKLVAHWPGLHANSYQKIENMITGRDDHGSTMINSRYVPSDLMPGLFLFTDENNFEGHIRRAKAAGKLPLILTVFTGNDPFSIDTPHHGGDEGGAHVVTIRDYMPGNPAKVLIDNEWTVQANHDTPLTAVPIHELYLSTLCTDDAAIEMQKDIELARKRNTPNSYAEFEVPRLQWISGNLDSRDFKTEIMKQIDEYAKERHCQNIDPIMIANAKQKLASIVDALPPKHAIDLLEREHQLGLITDQDFASSVSDYALGLTYRELHAKWVQVLDLLNEEMKLHALMSELPKDERQRIKQETEDLVTTKQPSVQ